MNIIYIILLGRLCLPLKAKIKASRSDANLIVLMISGGCAVVQGTPLSFSSRTNRSLEITKIKLPFPPISSPQQEAILMIIDYNDFPFPPPQGNPHDASHHEKFPKAIYYILYFFVSKGKILKLLHIQQKLLSR